VWRESGRVATSSRRKRSIGAKRGLVSGLIVVAAALLVASCAVPPSKKSSSASKEYFSEAEYGVAASPRVAMNGEIPKGGGRYQVGDAYKVKGKVYRPRENPSYSAVGLASWYGRAFHGRKTANGEVYDMGELTAAHPTLPLPSYVRVTNLSNDRSVVVRVNDRGPFSRGRIIDVSSTVAEMLDFKRSGTAKVKVEYVGKARMDGLDRQMLVSSYRGPNDFGGNTLFAWNEPAAPKKTINPNTPVLLASTAPQKPKKQQPKDGSIDLFGAQRLDGAPIIAPTFMPASSEGDPLGPLILRTGFSMSYAGAEPSSLAHDAAAELSAAGKERVRVQIGTFGDRANAERIAALLSDHGEAEIAEAWAGNRMLYTVRITATGGGDMVVRAAHDAGARDAFILSR
jgi:rare lipoprotein A